METGKNIALEFLKKHEGLRLTVYKDVAGVGTIGYGHTGRDVLPGMTITKGQAEELLIQDINRAGEAVDDNITVPLNPYQWAALVSFVFNVGAGAFASSTLLRAVNAGDEKAVSVQWMRWVYAGKRRIQGLENRRKDELELYFTKP